MLERRQGKRYQLKLPAQVRWKARGKGVGRAQGEIEDISSSGLFVMVPAHLPLGTTIDVTIILPVELTKVPVELSCLARVVGKNHKGKSQGISAIIEDFQLRPAPPKPRNT